VTQPLKIALLTLITLMGLVSGCASNPVATTSEPALLDEQIYAQALNRGVVYQVLVAETAFQQGRWDLAAQLYLHIAITSDDANLSARASEMALYTGNNELIFAAALRWSELAVHDPKPKVLMALCFLKNNQPQEALAVITQGLKDSPNDVELLYFRGIIAANNNQYDLAEKDWRRVLTLQPDHAPTLNALGFALTITTKNYTQALALIQRANRLDPNNPLILDSLGWVEFHLGKIQSAITHLTQAWTLMSDPEIAAHLGEVLWSSGHKNKAITLWQESLDLYPDHQILRETVQRLYGPHE